MKKSRFIYALIALIGLCAPAAPAQCDSKADQKTIAFLAEYRSNYGNSLVNQQPERLQPYYAEAVRLMPDFQKTVVSKRNAILYHRALLDRFVVQAYRRQEAEILDLGSMVAELGQFILTMRVRSTNQTLELMGKYQTIWEKRATGKLTLLTEAWNYNEPLAIEDQLRFEEVYSCHTAFQPHLPINSPIRFELAALNRLMEATVTQHDAGVWAQFYADDGSFGYSRHPLYKGKKAIGDFLKEHVTELPIFEKLALRNDRVDDLGRYVIEYASHIASWRQGEQSGIGTGKDLRIWRRENNGSLKLFRHMAMYD